ncbi:ATP-binding protein [Paenirhodobacter sp.]|uniref:ATP-binding protein n=1 Tax=Paenirhodobacter sp. TaxID=1965326 RepID=UPI003B3D0333
MTRRWRPSLAFVLGGALAATLAFSLAGLVALRYLGPVLGFRIAAIRAAVELLQDGGGLTPADACLLGDIGGANMQIAAQLAALRRAAQAREARYLGQTRLVELLPGLSAEFPGLALTASGEGQPLPIAAEGMAIVLGQMLRNAAEQDARRVTLTVAQEQGRIMLDVMDDGRGISAGNATRIFEPFFTTRRALGGTGMGLAVVRNLLAAHRADITLQSGQPTRFRIVFDCDQAGRCRRAW